MKSDKEVCEELADKRSKRQCTSGQPDLDKAISWYLKIGFEDGYQAALRESPIVRELVEVLKEIEKTWDVSDLTKVQPKIESEIGPYKIRNDSIAAMSIYRAIKCIENYEREVNRE